MFIVAKRLWPNDWMEQGGTLYGGRPQPRRLCVRRGPSPIPKKGLSPQFSAHVYCGQTAAWIETPLGTVVGLGAGDIVLDGDPPPLPKKGAEPLLNFRLMSIVAKRLDASIDTWHGGGPSSRTRYARWIPILQILHSPILAALLHGTRAVGASQTLRL